MNSNQKTAIRVVIATNFEACDDGTTNTDAKGTVIGVTETSKIKDAAKNTSVTVVVKEDGKGKVTSASATVENVSTNGKVTLLANVVSQISLTLKCMRFAHHKEIRI